MITAKVFKLFLLYRLVSLIQHRALYIFAFFSSVAKNTVSPVAFRKTKIDKLFARKW